MVTKLVNDDDRLLVPKFQYNLSLNHIGNLTFKFDNDNIGLSSDKPIILLKGRNIICQTMMFHLSVNC